MKIEELFNILTQDEKEELRALLYNEDSGKMDIYEFVKKYCNGSEYKRVSDALIFIRERGIVRFVDDVTSSLLFKCQNFGKKSLYLYLDARMKYKHEKK